MLPTPFILSCDTGRDDALTIWLAASGNWPLRAVIATYGNTTLQNATLNSAKVLAFSGRADVPVLAASSGPSRPHPAMTNIVEKRQRDYKDGLCGIDLPAVVEPPRIAVVDQARRIADMARESGPLEFLLLGPATDLAAMARIWGAETRRIVAGVTMMGGKPPALWEQMPGADFNILCDPFALRELLALELEFRFVTMATTWPVMLPLEALEALVPRTPLAEKAQALMIAHVRGFAPEPVFRFHDPAALLAAREHGQFRPVRVDVDCNENAPDFGRLTETPQGFPAYIHEAAPGHAEAYLAEILPALGFA